MSKKIKKFVKVLIIEFAIFVTFFLILIIGIELHYWYKFKLLLPPNDIKNYTWGHKVRWNKLGFRDKNYDLKPLENGFRIIVLGDSLTWGVGLSEEQRYSNLLERFLKKKYPNKNIEVLNFGICGGPTIQEAGNLKKYYKLLKPNLIIVGFCLNDPQPRAHNYSKEREYYFKKIESLLKLLQKLKLKGSAVMLSRVYENVLIKLGKIPFFIDALKRVYKKDSVEWKKFEDALRDIVRMSKEVTVYPPIFISLNEGTNVKKPTDYNNPDKILKLYLKWYAQVEETARKLGFIVVNCEKEFKEKLKNHIMAVVPGVDGHPTFEMNKIYAEKLFKTIEKHGFIKDYFCKLQIN